MTLTMRNDNFNQSLLRNCSENDIVRLSLFFAYTISHQILLFIVGMIN